MHQISAISMAILLLASTTSWTMDKHFCMGHLVDIAFFADADDCGMDMGEDLSESDSACCTDEIIVVKGQDDLKFSNQELSFDQQLFVCTLVMTYMDLFEGLPQQIVPHNDYPPPLLTQDLQLLDQVYLI